MPGFRGLAILLPMLLLAGVGDAFGQGKPPAASAEPAPSATAAPTQCPDDMTSYAGSDEVLTCICPAEQVARGSVWGTDTYSGDSATCRAALHAGAVGRQGGTVTLRMLPGQARYPGTTRRGVESISFGAYRSSYRFENVAPAAAPGTAASPSVPPAVAAAPTQCPDDMTSYDGSDEVLTCVCPAEQVARGSVWGTDTYSGDSATCRAALHAGAVGRQGGTVTLRMLPGQARYPGTTRRGVESISFGAYRSSYRFENIAPAAQAAAPAASGPTQCPDDMAVYAGSDETLTCLCPGEATLRGSIWGSDTYSADSATCRAAVHAGIIPLTGGTVSLQMLPGQPRYIGTTRRGVQSMSFGAYGASYRFMGGQAAVQGSGPVQAPVAETLRRTGQVQLYITFRTNSADLDLSAAAVLAQLREALAADPALRLGLIGHTDNRGSAAINIPLSYRRAEAVRQWLVASGIDAGRLSALGRGQDEPIADNATEDGRSLNRRVQAVRAP
ncbi:OmpA family protein [Roseomonas hellenica]|uniref:OmpA family protein n=1 Tax=Plastoroseomonas hellenica TaxID=2687306 RepID=A0ABS5EVI5_9PROT|nr:LCCL domain-containing protein [Plastoroseomonas hellenica]MBR0664294.1 OmpA family protein [Plastoroseomonas hellenica]